MTTATATARPDGITEKQIKQLSKTFNVKIIPLRQGLLDGLEQGFELSCGMSFDDLDDQWAYDTGTHIGACMRVREGAPA